ncbi:MAG: SseB protein N-terminal domain [Microbacteriaceae bacterium]|nr:SseB protein N-terminal domain [Microbacteriaceae bacterium]
MLTGPDRRDAPAEVPANHELAAAIGVLASDPSDAARAEVYRHLLSGPLIAAVVIAPADGAGTTIDLLTEPTSDGTDAVLAFTHHAAFRAWGLADTFATAEASALIEMIVAKGLGGMLLDPAGPVTTTIGGWELLALAEGRQPDAEDRSRWDENQARAPTRPLVVSGPLQPIDHRLRSALGDAVAADPTIIAAYLLESDRIGLRRQLIIALDIPAEGFEAAVRALTRRLKPLANPYAVLRFSRATRDEKLTALASRAVTFERR